MQVRAVGNALAIALISILLMLGALSISLVEFVPALTPTASPLPSSLPVILAFTPQPTLPPPPMIETTPTPTIVFTPTITATSPNTCPIPSGWGQVIVQPYDTLDNIAGRYRIDANQLLLSNCLLSASLITGSVLYVPPVPTNTAIACNPGAFGWIKNYVVRSGDTFYSIATRYGVTVLSMKNANCRTSDQIYPGEILWVPNKPMPTPYPSLTPQPWDTATPQPTEPLTETALPPLPYTLTPVPTPVPDTPEPIPTPTAFP